MRFVGVALHYVGEEEQGGENKTHRLDGSHGFS